jgi:hypothetical protein
MLKVFVGSSTAAKCQAKYLMKGCASEFVRFDQPAALSLSATISQYFI